MASNVIVCEPTDTVKVRVTGVAARYEPLPAWLAVIEQVPTARTVTVATFTVQTESEFDAKLTVRPEVAVALTVKGATPTLTLLRLPKEIVCDCCAELTWIVIVLLLEVALPEPPP